MSFRKREAEEQEVVIILHELMLKNNNIFRRVWTAGPFSFSLDVGE